MWAGYMGRGSSGAWHVGSRHETGRPGPARARPGRMYYCASIKRRRPISPLGPYRIHRAALEVVQIGLTLAVIMPTFIKTLADFTSALDSAGDKLVVVDFTASWCGPCQMIAPKFEAMSKEFTSAIFYKVDVDENDETAEKYGISAMPTFVFFHNGSKVDSVVGGNEAKLRENIKKYSKKE